MGRRYRLYPTLGQAERLTGWGHTCRAVWNIALAQRQFAWSQRGVTLRAIGQGRHLTEARAELAWLADLPAQSAQEVLRHLDAAFENWWNSQHPAGPPRFKKRSAHLSVSFPGQAVAVRALNRRWAQVRLPKIGWVRSACLAPSTARFATPRCHATRWVGMLASAWQPVSGLPQPTGCRGVGWTSGSHARRSSPTSRPRVACRRPSPMGNGGACSAWSVARPVSCVGQSGTTVVSTRIGYTAA
jgi:Helix-turn-helix domain